MQNKYVGDVGDFGVNRCLDDLGRFFNLVEDTSVTLIPQWSRIRLYKVTYQNNQNSIITKKCTVSKSVVEWLEW
jgi:hypothetical protein